MWLVITGFTKGRYLKKKQSAMATRLIIVHTISPALSLNISPMASPILLAASPMPAATLFAVSPNLASLPLAVSPVLSTTFFAVSPVLSAILIDVSPILLNALLAGLLLSAFDMSDGLL